MLKIGKTTAGLLSAALVMGAVATAPMVSAEPKPSGREVTDKNVDMGSVNTERLGKALIKRGEIKKNTSPAEVEQAVQKYVEERNIPNGVDTSTKFGKKAQKGLKKMQARSIAKAAKGKRKGKATHTDNIAVALVEFPDYTHNKLKEEKGSLYTKDFSESHYRKMLFSPRNYTTPEGLKLTTMAKYYKKQSGGTWTVDGTVTPWMKAKHNAAYYGENDPANNDDDKAPRELVVETLDSVGKAIKGKEAQYDQRDPYDLDGDSNVMEPDGRLDNLMVVHSGVGEDAGGGDLGEDAIWSHRWTLKNPVTIPGTSLKAYDYMIQPEDGAVGVFSHEYGHNLGLPDLYDTNKEDKDKLGSPVGCWSLMSAGSWNGEILGTEPVGFDPWSKEFLQATYGGYWSHPMEIDLKDIQGKKKVDLKEAVNKKLSGKLLKINLPDVEKKPPTQPKTGKYSYFSTVGNDLDTKMTSKTIDLTGVSKASLSFDSWRQIEKGYDYLYVNVIDEATQAKKQLKAYDDDTKGKWVTENLDLSAFAGKKIKLEFQYVTDGGLALDGFYVDNIAVTGDNKTVLEDGAEDPSKANFDLSGFTRFDGSNTLHPSYYLVEWRTHHGVDKGLAKLRRGDSFLTYDPGMVVWFYDGRYANNRTSEHPGYGMVGVVDSHQRVQYWNKDWTNPATDRYQVGDAAFGLSRTSPINIKNYLNYGDMKYRGQPGVPLFNDHRNYTMPGAKEVGKVLPKHGLRIKVLREKNRGGVIQLSKRQ
ncbi:immune inhibitor A domain-containing protein [Salinithrix halophila]|uniref:Immune inhibitor A domain-containing protein n=1 Tax=Salinithrix halophila TaxID=1485204 RepID=A0ABV8JJ43_9BACL